VVKVQCVDQAMARPSIGRLLWASNSTRPHHVGGSKAATWAEKMIYSKISTMSPDPHGKVPDPSIYKSRTPGMVQDLHVGKLDLSDGIRTLYMGSGPLTAGSWDSGTENTQVLIKDRRGSGADTCSDFIVYASAPRPGGDPMLPRGLLHVT
jgi:hypothetical protein